MFGDNDFPLECQPGPEDALTQLTSASYQLAAELYQVAGRGDLQELKHLCTVHKLDVPSKWRFLASKHSAKDYIQHAFRAATYYKQAAILEYLYDIGAKPDGHDIERVSLEEDVDILKLFVRRGVDLNQEAPSGASPLRWAASNEEMLDIWLDQGADPNGGVQSADYGTRTPLDATILAGRLDLAKKLVAHGADPKLSQALCHVAQNSADVRKACEMAEYFIGLGCDVNIMYEENINYGPGRPLHYAAQVKDSEPLIEILIKHGAEPRARSSLDETPLDWAVKAEANSSKKEELFMGARTPGYRLPQWGVIYKHNRYLPLLGMFRDEDRAMYPSNDSIVEGSIQWNESEESEGGILSRLSSFFTKDR